MYPIIQSDKTPLCDAQKYESMYADSINNPDKFWATQAKEFLDWTKDWKKTSNVDYTKGQIEWFKGGELNVAYNCIDRHLPKRAKQRPLFGRVITPMLVSTLLISNYMMRWQN